MPPVSSSWCYQITDKALERLAKKVKGLKSVNLKGCRNITPAGARTLLISNPHLWHFIILDCEQISEHESDEIMRQFPNITRNSPASAPSI